MQASVPQGMLEALDGNKNGVSYLQVGAAPGSELRRQSRLRFWRFWLINLIWEWIGHLEKIFIVSCAMTSEKIIGIIQIIATQQRSPQKIQQILWRNYLETNCVSMSYGFQLNFILPIGGGRYGSKLG